MEIGRLRRLLVRQQIATMPELKAALGTEADMTVFRALRRLAYRTSYSHRGKYYTLDAMARFDAWGLWSRGAVRFSKHGTLRRTCEAFVSESEAGYASDELERLLSVGVKDALRTLAREGKVFREKAGGRFIHFAADAPVREAQRQARQAADAHPPDLAFGKGAVSDEIQAAIVLFLSLLDEQQRRVYAGLESLKLGHGGDRRIADLLGLDAETVARGRQQIFSGDVQRGRVRREGGGRPPVEKKRPA